MSLASTEGAGSVLAPFVLPGETVSKSSAGTTCTPSLVEVLDAVAGARRASVPSIYALCGGCHYQHAPYEFQLARKVEILREQLRAWARSITTGEIDVISGPPLGYRNRAQFHIADGKIGYLAARSHELVRVGECPISSPRLNQALD